MKYTNKLILNGVEYSFAAGSSGWQPGANTLAYYPLDTDFKNTVTGTALTAHNSATIGTLGTVSCLDLTSNRSYLDGTVSTLPQGGQERTNMFWVKWNYTGSYPAYGYGSAGTGNGDTVYSNSNISWSQYGGSIANPNSVSISNRIHIAITISSGTAKMYVNGTLVNFGTFTINTNGTVLYLGKNAWDNAYLGGYLSRFIVENKAWTADEITAYYNSTKSLYGIS